MSGAVHAEKKREDQRALMEIAAPVARTPTLTVGHALDPAEAEADRVADSVIAKLRAGDAGGQHEHVDGCDHGVQRVASPSEAPVVGMEGGALPDSVSRRIEGARSAGTPLQAGVRQRMESAFGSDLSGVRVHTDVESAGLNRSVSARAFTTGQDIFFGAGEYRPDTPSGEHMLAHELAHTRQQPGVHRKTIHRTWDYKKPKWETTESIKTLKDRPIWFFKDKDGDQMVVKSEDQPVGLGSLIGAMHLKASGVKSVEQAGLSQGDRKTVAKLLMNPQLSSDMSWDDYGKFVATQPGFVSSGSAWQDGMHKAADIAANGKANVVAMTMAQGTDAGNKAAADAHVGKVDDHRSAIRKMLLDPNHMQLLGKMTAIDVFMGNQDRGLTGNIGNWFYGPANEITVLDHVDPGMAMRTGTAALMTDFNTWRDELGRPFLKDKPAAASLASECIRSMLGRFEQAGDDTLYDWAQAKPAGGSEIRMKSMQAAFADGVVEGRDHLLKIFSTTRFKGSKSAHNAKKKLRAAAKAATEQDANDGVTGGIDYYEVVKQRIAWLKKPD
jgi:hypothetical protein